MNKHKRGKHQRPSQARKNIKRAGVGVVTTGTAIVLNSTPVLAAPAPEGSPWDVIADCESGNKNVENAGPSTASGYFQIIDGTWRGAGGEEFAQRAIDASYEEQLFVAQNIAKSRGSLADWNASKHCWGDKISSDVPADLVDKAELVGPVAPAPVVEETPPPVIEEESPAATSTYTVESGDTMVKIGVKTGFNWQEIASLNGVVDPFLIFPGQVMNLPVPDVSEYTVVSGDTLSKIAQDLALDGWQDLYQSNIDVIGDDPNLILPGQVFFVGGLPLSQAPTVVEEDVIVEPAGEEKVVEIPKVETTAIITNSAGPVAPQAQLAANEVFANVLGASLITIGGTRASAKDPDGHPAGKALDYMVLSDAALGDAIVRYHIEHWARLGVEYIIWQQRIMHSAGGAWESMGDRGSATANHYDHVHVNYN